MRACSPGCGWECSTPHNGNDSSSGGVAGWVCASVQPKAQWHFAERLPCVCRRRMKQPYINCNVLCSNKCWAFPVDILRECKWLLCTDGFRETTSSLLKAWGGCGFPALKSISHKYFRISLWWSWNHWIPPDSLNLSIFLSQKWIQ